MKIFNGIPKRRIIIDISFSIIWSFMNVLFSNKLATTIVDNIVVKNSLFEIIIYFIVFIIIWELVELVGDVYGRITNCVLENNVNKYYFNKLYNIKPSILKQNNTGYISGLLNKLVSKQANAYRHIILYLPIAIVYVFYFGVKMWQLHPLLGFSLFAISILSNLFRLFINSASNKKSIELAKVEGERNKAVVDFVSNINTVQKMKSLDFMNQKLDKKNKKCIKLTRDWSILEEIAFCGNKLLVFLYTPLAMIIYELLPKESININDFLAILSIVSIQLVHNTKSLSVAITCYNNFKGSLIKLEEIIAKDNLRKELLIDDFKNLKINNLTYIYQIKDKKNNKNINTIEIKIPKFELNKGDKVCIYGESGQGKTTLLHIVSGEIETNEVLINDSIYDKRLECVFIAQDTEMFDMSLRDNLTLGKDVKDEELIEYINKVGMGDWFNSQKKGLETLLGERGVFVSTGQRQRLNLIRGLLRDEKEVYLLDEPTSNVDEITEENMIELIKEILKNKTIIIVTHRPKIKAICNKIYKFENGTIFKEK